MMSRKNLSSGWLRAAVVAVMSSASVAHAVDLTKTVSLDIEAQPLVSALIQLAEQARIQVMSSGADVDRRQAPRIAGDYSIGEALRLMLAESGLSYVSTGPNTIIVAKPAGAESGARVARETALSRVALADSPPRSEPVQAGMPVSPVVDSTNDSIADERGSRIELEEVLVTGSHIRGVQNLSSPVITFDRKEIEASGYATTQQFIQSMPQNLSNISDATTGAANGGLGTPASYDSAGVNLRGLGGDATLVLMNGRRMAAAGNGSFVDLSLVPLSAVERIEILADGASAIYGSDAVGGVVNLVLREDLEGAETRLRFGSVTSGGQNELMAGQILGHSWDSGRALVSYEYFRQTDLDSGERDFIDPIGSYSAFKLIPGQRRHGALALIEQQLTDRVGFNGDVFYAQRRTEAGYFTGFPTDLISDVRQMGVAAGLSIDVTNAWQVRLRGLFDRNDSDLEQIDHFPGAALTTVYGNESRLWSVDLAADGPLMTVAGGDVRLGVGGQARQEKFSEEYAAYPAKIDRDVAAVYAEVLVPWISERNRRAGFESLELTLAARYEDYSDFGQTFNPKAGLSWKPIQGLNLRGSWGTSFKAPLLSQLNAGNSYAWISAEYFNTETGALGTGLYLTGNGENLGPEESTNWTLGFDFMPRSLPALSISASYFNIDYEHRIRAPFPNGYDRPGVLLDPVYQTIVMHDPDPALVERVIDSSPNSLCFNYATFELCDGAQYLGQIEAIVDGRSRNLAGVRMSGVDVMFGYGIASAVGDWRVQLSGTQLLNNRERLVPGGPETKQLNDVWRPVDLRFRGSVSFHRDAFDAMLAVNYVDDYRDRRDRTFIGGSMQRSSVASWTTMDLNLQYELGSWGNAGAKFHPRAQLSAVNVFDKDPPYVASLYGMYFDGVNANPRGRFISLQISAQW